MKNVMIAVIIAMMAGPVMADVQCKKFPSTEPGPIVTFPGNQCPLGWQPA